MNHTVLKQLVKIAQHRAIVDLRSSNAGRPRTLMPKKEFEMVEGMLKAGAPSIGTIYKIMKEKEMTSFPTYPKFIRAHKECVYHHHIHSPMVEKTAKKAKVEKAETL